MAKPESGPAEPSEGGAPSEAGSTVRDPELANRFNDRIIVHAQSRTYPKIASSRDVTDLTTAAVPAVFFEHRLFQPRGPHRSAPRISILTGLNRIATLARVFEVEWS
jgi:hypothetical protein